jgi:DnaJ-class molecular chaperone
MTYEIIPTEAEEIPTAFYDPNIAEEITKEGRKTLAEMLKYTEVCPDCGGEGYTFFVDQGEPDPDSKCTTCKGTGKIKLKR